MWPEMSHHISVPRLPSAWNGTSGKVSPRAAGTTRGASPRRGATRRVLITSFTGSGHETGILSYYLHLGNYSQPPHPEKPSLENKSSPSPGTQHGPASHSGDKCPFRAGTQGTGSSWVNRAGLVSESCRWCPAVKRAEPSRVGGGRQPGAAGKRTGNQLMLGRRQQQAQLAGERRRDPGQRLKQPQHGEILVVKSSEGWARRCSDHPSWLEMLKRLAVFTHQQSSLGKSLLTN